MLTPEGRQKSPRHSWYFRSQKIWEASFSRHVKGTGAFGAGVPMASAPSFFYRPPATADTTGGAAVPVGDDSAAAAAVLCG